MDTYKKNNIEKKGGVEKKREEKERNYFTPGMVHAKQHKKKKKRPIQKDFTNSRYALAHEVNIGSGSQQVKKQQLLRFLDQKMYQDGKNTESIYPLWQAGHVVIPATQRPSHPRANVCLSLSLSLSTYIYIYRAMSS